MKTGWVVAMTLAVTMSVSGTAGAMERFSCGDLEEMANAMDEVANAIEDHGRIEENSVEDKALRELLDGLRVVAAVEGNSNLDASVQQMEGAWHNMNWAAFVKNIDTTTAIFDAILTLECPQQ